jgi:AcrR family transcriptional regulator
MNRRGVKQTVKSGTAETKERILDAAERLFADRGFEVTSIRDITSAADVNLASINYHFRTKRELIAAVFIRRVGPINQRRLTLLDELEQKAGPKPPTVEALIEAMIRPAAATGLDKPQGSEILLRLTGRFFSEPNVEIDQLIHANFQKMMSRFTGAFLRVLPGLTQEELYWRLKFTFGALHHVLLTLNKQDSTRSHPGKRLDGEELVQRLVTFAAAGIKAPASH